MVGRLRRSVAAASLSLAVLALASPSSVGAAGPAATKPISFDVSIGSPCVLVDGPKNTRGTLAVRGPGGLLRGQLAMDLGDDGQTSECIYSMVTGIAGGDVVSFKTDAGKTRWLVPRLSLHIDRATDRYIVRGAPGTAVAVDGMRGFLAGPIRTLFGYDELTIGQDGTVEHDPGVNLRGTDMLTVNVEDGPNSAMLMMFTPFLSVSLGDPTVFGAVAPGPDGVVRLVRDGTPVARGSAAEIAPGQFYTRLRNASDAPVSIRPGDRVELDGPSHIAMRAIPATVTADRRTDTITGTCTPNAPYTLTARAPFTSDRFLMVQLRGTTNAAGTLRRHVKGDLRKGDELSLVCQSAQGDLTEVERLVPR